MKDFKKYFHIPGTPEEVYAAITNPLSLRLWTGDEVEIGQEPGSEFSLWGGSITGKNLEFEQDKKLVQQWYFGDTSPESIVTIKLHPDKDACSLELRHTNIPDADFDDITAGWMDVYMASLIDFFQE